MATLFSRGARAVLMGVGLTLTVLPAAAQEAPVTAPSSDTMKDADTHFQRARQLYDEGDFPLALVEFKRAYDLSPNYRVLYNIAQVNIQLFNYAAARTAMEKYLQDGGTEVSATKRAQADTDLKMLRDRTAYLQVAPKPDGAEVSVDDAPAVKAPFAEPLLVNAGQRKIVVSAPGYVSATKTVTLAGGDRSNLPIVLVPVASELTRVATPMTRTTTRPSYTPATIGWVGTGAFAIGAAIVGAMYLNKQSDIRRLRNPAEPVTAAERDDVTSSAKHLAVGADVLGLAAIACAGVATYFTVRPPKHTETTTAQIRLLPTGVAGTF